MRRSLRFLQFDVPVKDLKPEVPHLSETCSVWGVFGGGSISPEKVDSSESLLRQFDSVETKISHMIAKHEVVCVSVKLRVILCSP